MAKIRSSEILVYPTAYRGKTTIDNKLKLFNPESVLNTERNITRALKILPDYVLYRDGFVVSSEYDSAKDFEIVINGYYFKIRAGAFRDIDASWTDVYAHIYTADLFPEWDASNTNYIGTSLISAESHIFNAGDDPVTDQVLDNSNADFVGLVYNNVSTLQPESNAHEYILHILHKNDQDTWVIPEEAKLKYNAENIYSEITNKNILNRFKMFNGNVDIDAENSYIKMPVIGGEGENYFAINTTDYGLDVHNAKPIWLSTYASQLRLTQNEIDLKLFDCELTKSSIHLNTNDVDIVAPRYLNLESTLNSIKGDIDVYNNITLKEANATIQFVNEYQDVFIRGDNANSLQIGKEQRNNNSTTFRPILTINTVESTRDSDCPGTVWIDGDFSVHSGDADCCSVATFDNVCLLALLKEKALKIDSNGYISSNDLTKKSDAPASNINSSSFTYVDTVHQDAYGKIVETRKIANFTSGLYQGTFKIGSYNIAVTGLSTSSSPIFYAPTCTSSLTAGAVNGGAKNVLGTASVITYNSSGQVIGSWGSSSNSYGYAYLCNSSAQSTIILKGYDGQIEANSYNARSDRRLKENIIDYKPNKSILDLNVYKYDFINGSKNQIGCIAQELQEICPEIVSEDEKGYLSIQESKLVYLLLDEVKKLKAEVSDLKSK